MKTIWTIISVVALANIMAFAGVVAWLKASDRLSRERVEQVRLIFAATVAQQEQATVQADAATKEAEKKKAEEARLAEPPVTAADRIAAQEKAEDRSLQAILRREREINDLRTSLLRRQEELDGREKKLTADRAAFEEQVKRIAEIEGAQQFKAAVSTLEGQKPRDAKTVLQALLERNQRDQVLAYFAKMDEGKRTKVLAEFVKDQPTVAADLLEGLRTRGVVPNMTDVAPPAAGTQGGARTAGERGSPTAAGANASAPGSHDGTGTSTTPTSVPAAGPNR